MESVDGAQGFQISSDEIFAIQCDSCEYSHITKKAAAFCQDCTEYFCETCETAHGKLKLTRSHKLLSGALMPPKRSAGLKMAVSDTVLCSCMKNEVPLFCKEHYTLFCVNCKALHHRRCTTSDIGEESKAFDVSTEEITDKANSLHETISTILERREEDSSKLSLEAKGCRDRAQQFREELSIKLVCMEAETLSIINFLETKEKEKLTKTIDTCKAALYILDMNCNKLQLAKERNDRRSIFLLNIQLTQLVKYLKTIKEEVTKEAYQPHIAFECNPALAIASNLGKVVKSFTSQILKQKGFDEMYVTARNQINIKLQSDTKPPCISGLVFLSWGELFLCDYGNRKLKLLDESLQIKDSVGLSGRPWDVAPVNQHNVIVTFPFGKCFQFIQVSPTLALGQRLELGMECNGVAVSRDSIYILFAGSGEGKIGIYDLTGKKRRIIGQYNCKYGKVVFKNPYYIAVSNDEKIYLSDTDEKSKVSTVYCLESNGNILYTVSDTRFKGCLGIRVDDDENVLVCDWKSNKVFLITKDGKKVCEYLTQKDGLCKPYTTSYRRSDGTLIVTCRECNDLLVFTVQ